MPDTYIKECITAQHTVNVIMLNGYVMTGKILEEASDSILVLNGKCKKLVYKHGISTIEPAIFQK